MLVPFTATTGPTPVANEPFKKRIEIPFPKVPGALAVKRAEIPLMLKFVVAKAAWVKALISIVMVFARTFGTGLAETTAAGLVPSLILTKKILIPAPWAPWFWAVNVTSETPAVPKSV